MIKTIIGVILLLIPFLLLYRFKDRRVGFAYILSFLIAFHLLVAIVTQLFGVFNHWVIFVVNLVVCLVILFKIDYRKFIESLKKIKLNWVLIVVIIILLIQLFSIHYDYTGKATSVVQNYKDVKDLRYPYPYFSDEWSGVALVKYSMESGKLPLVNPLWENSYFSNFELPFHSFVSEIMLLLNLNPLLHYTILTLFTSLLICLLVYFILRINKVSRLAASIACLCVPYIINGANLPGLWTLIPLTLGMISMLLGFFFISLGKKRMILLLGFLTLIFYPPLFVFYAPALVLYFVFAEGSKKEKFKWVFLFFIVCLIAAALMAIRIYMTNEYSLDNTIAQISSRLYYSTLTINAIPSFPLWKVIPIPVFIFSFIGIIRSLKKEKLWLAIPVLVGLFYWWLYSFILNIIIIGHARVVVSTSILLVLVSGFGFHYVFSYLRRYEPVRRYKILQILQILVLIFFLILAFSYTQRDGWKDLKLYSVVNDHFFSPAAPANVYLQEDDLRLFNFTEKRFLSLPWKGLVVGTATGNYPLETKPSTITNQIDRYYKFVNADCKGKREIAEKHEIDYIYSSEFDCRGFEKLGESEEGLILYEVR